MWTIVKIDKKRLNFFKDDITKKLGSGCIFYSPKLIVQKYKNSRLINKEFNLLGDYIFCFHSEFKNPLTLCKLKFTKGLKYFLSGFLQSQNEISDFVTKCKRAEDKKGYLSINFCDLKSNKNYKFVSGPFTEKIFKIINLQKNNIEILMGNIRTKINKKKFLISPI